MEALGRLGAGVAHDLNNLLGAILSSMEYLSRLDGSTLLSDRDVQECHEDIQRAAERAAGLTGRVTASVRRPASELEFVDLSELVREVARLSSRTFPRSIDVQCAVEPSLYVRGNSGALHQLVLNLCINARDAMPEGGALGLTLSRQGPSPDGLDGRSTQPGTGLLQLTVSDSGVGMSPETMQRIFEPLFTTKKAGTGTGLGLATVQQITRSHGGRVEVKSKPGSGTLFRIYLPEERKRRAPPRTRETSPMRRAMRPEELKGKRILLVDDEEVVARSAARLLKRLGYDVLVVNDGQAAVDFFEGSDVRPDLVLLDLDMPLMDGEETQRRLSRIEPDVRIVFVSGHRDMAREQLVMKAGARGFVRKPYEMRQLERAIQEALNDGQGFGPLPPLLEPR